MFCTLCTNAYNCGGKKRSKAQYVVCIKRTKTLYIVCCAVSVYNCAVCAVLLSSIITPVRYKKRVQRNTARFIALYTVLRYALCYV